MRKLIAIKVEEFTSPVMVTIAAGSLLSQALLVMQDKEIRHLPVTHQNKIVGIISHRDVMAFLDKSWSQDIRVEDIMQTDMLTVYKNDELGEVAFKLSSLKVGSALVLDEDSSVYGIFTTTDALNALVEILMPEAFEKSGFIRD